MWSRNALNTDGLSYRNVGKYYLKAQSKVEFQHSGLVGEISPPGEKSLARRIFVWLLN
jgi:hypothetical protein